MVSVIRSRPEVVVVRCGHGAALRQPHRKVETPDVARSCAATGQLSVRKRVEDREAKGDPLEK
jgi:hypothetical protein